MNKVKGRQTKQIIWKWKQAYQVEKIKYSKGKGKANEGHNERDIKKRNKQCHENCTNNRRNCAVDYDRFYSCVHNLRKTYLILQTPKVYYRIVKIFRRTRKFIAEADAQRPAANGAGSKIQA